MSKFITFSVRTTSGMELVDITGEISAHVEQSGVNDGTVLVYTPHTTAGITINENADPSVPHDIVKFMNELVPHKNYFSHGEGNSPSHILSSLFSPSQMVIVNDGKLLLGTWQGIFFCEFDGPRSRKVHLKFISDKYK